MSSQADKFLSRFVNNTEAHAQQWATPEKHGYMTVREPITTDLFAQHLRTQITLGVYAISQTNTCNWIAWDIDKEDEIALAYLIDWLDSHGVINIRESKRPGRSGHLWVFVDSPIPSQTAFQFGMHGKIYANLHAEVFPKQASINPGSLGNLLRIPLGLNRKASAMNLGLFDGCPSLAIDQQLLWFIQQPVNSADKILELIKTLPVIAPKGFDKPKKSRANQGNILDKFPDTWPMKRMPSGIIIGLCPVCHNEGHDRTASNLSINPEAGVMYCHRDQGVHSFIDILRALDTFRMQSSVK